MEKKSGTFYKTLTFQREHEGDKEKVAHFTDKFGKESKVITTWGGIIPNLKYSCQLEITDEKDDATNTLIYKLVRYRIWIDKLAVNHDADGAVVVTLDEQSIDHLTFDCVESTDFEEKVEELKLCFREKSLQLNGKEDIADFVNLYRKTCLALYESKKKKLKKSLV